MTRLIAGLALFVASTGSAWAQQPLALDIRNGQVSLTAQNVPLRAILMEWARIGGTNVVGADRVSGPPVTLELTSVSERQALEILLRPTSGYMLALRPAGTQGASIYNRILIMPPSTAPRALPTPAVAAARFPTPPPAEEEEPEPPDVTLEGPVRPAGPVRMPSVTGTNAPVVITQPPSPLPVPETGSPTSTPGVVVISPNNPFGVPAGSSSQPGVIAPVPPPAPQRPIDSPD